MKTKTMQELLDLLEQSGMIIAGEIAIAKTMGIRPNLNIMENNLANIVAVTVELKNREGLPVKLITVEEEDAEEKDRRAWEADMNDMQQIKQEWYAYRHEGDETPPTPPSKLWNC